MKNIKFQAIDLLRAVEPVGSARIVNKPGRRSNPIPDRPEEEEEPLTPGKEDPTKKKKKKSLYEVTY